MREFARACLVLFVAVSATAVGQAQGPVLPQQEPQLRIEAGMHLDPVSAMSASANGRLLATASRDKTVRLWDLPFGGLRRVLRVPIGPGNEGTLNAIAMSSDGTLVAAGGWDAGWSATRQMHVYVFDTTTGVVTRRLGPLPQVVSALAFSRDATLLAIGLSGAGGLVVLDAKTGEVRRRDDAYEDTIWAAEFTSAGHLITASADGRVRTYNADLSAGASARLPSGSHPAAMALAPDSRSLAVGHWPTMTIEVLALPGLERMFVVDTSAIAERINLNSLAWSSDGTHLYGGGSTRSREALRIIRWGNGGKGSADQYSEYRNVRTVLSLPGNALAFEADDLALGLLSAQGRLLMSQVSPAGQLTELRASPDAARVRVKHRRGAWVFDLAQQNVLASSEVEAGLRPPDTMSLQIEWDQEKREIKLGGKALNLGAWADPLIISLPPARRVFSTAIGPDRSFVVAVARGLVRFDIDGNEIWRIATSSPPEGSVTLSEDGRVVVSTHADGTIRWRRASDGADLLSLFIHAKDQRWIAWTPKGYYTASPAGEGLIGWHFNRDWGDAADFFPAHRFRNRYYRPDIVQKVLVTLDEDRAVEEADNVVRVEWQERSLQRLRPPVLEIISPKDGTAFDKPETKIQYTVRTPGNETFGNVEVYFDNARVSSRGFVPVAEPAVDTTGAVVRTVDVVLPRRDVKVSLVARSGEKASEPKSVSLQWIGDAREPAKIQPRLLALLVGVSAYRREALKLDFAHQDAVNLAVALKAQEGRAFLEVVTKVISNAERDQIREGFDWLSKTARNGDLTVMLFSGHGTTQNNTFFFLPADSDPGNLNVTAISGHEIVGTLQGLPGGKLLLIDACRAGGGIMPSGLRQVPVDINKLANDMGQPLGSIFFGSSSVGELSYENAAMRAGVFTAALIEGLAGKADLSGDGKVETDELAVWLRRRVPELTGRKQNPLRHQSAPVEYTMTAP